MTTTRPQALAPHLKNIPAELKALPRWICWRHYWHKTRQKWVKMPYDPKTGNVAASDNPATWAEFSVAENAFEFLGEYDGLGFMFSAEDDIVGGDLDKCIDEDTGELSALAKEALEKIGGYWEVSPSGRGLHFITRATLARAYKDDRIGVELYGEGRYFTITGRVYNGHTDIDPMPEELDWFITKHFPKAVKQEAKRAEASQTKAEGFFAKVNELAMAHLPSWIPALFPMALPYQGGFRVRSAQLGRDLEEDISIVPEGIVDFGVADLGDEKEGKRTPIDLVVEWYRWSTGDDDPFPPDPKEAAFWLCEQLEVEPADLGWGEAAGKTKRERQAAAADANRQVLECNDPYDLLDTVAKICGEASYGSLALRTELVKALQDRYEDLTGHKVSVVELRRAMRPKKDHKAAAQVRRSNTEFGNAERMLDRFGDGLRYVPELDQWLIWTGEHWRRALGVEVEHMAKETIRSLPLEIDNCQTDEEREAFFKWCAASQKAAMVGNMVRLAGSDPRVVVPMEKLDPHANLFGVANGAVDLTTGVLVPPNKADLITVATTVPYNPKATCPLFEQTILDVFHGDKEMVAFVQRLIGYTLLGDPTEDILIIPYGGGSNGKSTILGTIRKVLGNHAKAAAAETFLTDGRSGASAGGPREDVLRLRGARFVYVSEPEEGAELREGMVKALTGGDAIPARGLFSKASVEVEPTWVAIMPTNHLPIVKGSDHAIWRRLMPVPFTRNFDKDKSVKKDMNRAGRLEAESEGILAWCVQGAVQYQLVGLNPPAEVRKARDSYREDMDLLADWLAECCEVGDGEECRASTNALWASWEAFAKRNGQLNYIRSSKALGRRLAGRFDTYRTAGGRGFLGLRVKDEGGL